MNPCALMWRSYAGLALARLGDHDRVDELVDEELDASNRVTVGSDVRLQPGGSYLFANASRSPTARASYSATARREW